MSDRQIYTSKDRKAAIRLYKKGWGYLRISQAVGCCATTVKDWIDAAIEEGTHGIERHKAPGYSKKFKDKVIADYLKRREEESLDKIARRHEISPATLRRWLDKKRIVTRSSRPPVYDRKAIEADIDAKLPKAKIAEKHGCSESWVYRVQQGK